MYLTVVCPNCQTTYTVGQLDSLPQPSLLTSTLADLYHGHQCRASQPESFVAA